MIFNHCKPLTESKIITQILRQITKQNKTNIGARITDTGRKRAWKTKASFFQWGRNTTICVRIRKTSEQLVPSPVPALYVFRHACEGQLVDPASTNRRPPSRGIDRSTAPPSGRKQQQSMFPHCFVLELVTGKK